jgi:5-methylcytosine-specific restriction endonuclease McrA
MVNPAADVPDTELMVPASRLPATEVDHKTPIRIDPSRRLDWTNLQALCRRHHSQKTAAETLNRR